MAKGKGIFNFISKKAKQGAKFIKSNVTANADDVVRQAAAAQKTKIAKGLSNQADELFEAMANSDDVFSFKAMDEAMKGVQMSDKSKSAMIKDIAGGKISAEDFRYMNQVQGSDDAYKAFDNAYSKIQKEIGATELGGQYRQVLTEKANLDSKFKDVLDPNTKYVGDEAARLKKAKMDEYKRIKKEKIASGQEWDREAILSELDESGKYNFKDPYQDINKKYDSKGRKEMAQKRVEELTSKRDAELSELDEKINGLGSDEVDKMRGEILNEKRKKISDKYEKDIGGANDYVGDKFKKEQEKIFEKTGFKSGTRAQDFKDTVGTGSAAASTGAEYFWNGADKSQRAARIGVAGATAAGGALGLRYLSGGNLRYNADGEKDIAGIPFI